MRKQKTMTKGFDIAGGVRNLETVRRRERSNE